VEARWTLVTKSSSMLGGALVLALSVAAAGQLAIGLGAPQADSALDTLSSAIGSLALLVGGVVLLPLATGEPPVEPAARTVMSLVGASAVAFLVAHGLTWDTYYLPSRVRVVEHAAVSPGLLVALAVGAVLAIVTSRVAPRLSLWLTTALLWTCTIVVVLMSSGH
jgi:hypothetical protein